MAEENLRKCFVVIDSSYDVGLSAYAFWGQEDAKKVFKRMFRRSWLI